MSFKNLAGHCQKNSTHFGRCLVIVFKSLLHLIVTANSTSPYSNMQIYQRWNLNATQKSFVFVWVGRSSAGPRFYLTIPYLLRSSRMSSSETSSEDEAKTQKVDVEPRTDWIAWQQDDFALKPFVTITQTQLLADISLVDLMERMSLEHSIG